MSLSSHVRFVLWHIFDGNVTFKTSYSKQRKICIYNRIFNVKLNVAFLIFFFCKVVHKVLNFVYEHTFYSDIYTPYTSAEKLLFLLNQLVNLSESLIHSCICLMCLISKLRSWNSLVCKHLFQELGNITLWLANIVPRHDKTAFVCKVRKKQQTGKKTC